MSKRAVPLVMTPEEFRRRMSGATPSAEDIARAHATGAEVYERTHWGTSPVASAPSVALAANPFLGDLVEMGGLVAVEYRTVKDGERAVWRHEFRKRHLPILAFNAGGLVVCGGRYRVTTRGIEG